MRKLKIIEHISLDGVIQVRGPGEDGDFPHGDWTAPYRTPAGRDAILAELVSTKAMPSGIIFSAYKATGPLKAG